MSVMTIPTVASAEEQPLSIIVADENVTMTATADSNGMKVATLKPGTRVKLMRQEASWSKIEYNGRLGWVRNDVVQPFTHDLLPTYSKYYELLESTEHIIYALVADFTQDGIEELYIVSDSNPSKGQYIETIYSGGTVIYQKNMKHGLSVLKDSTDYYLFHHTQTNSEKKFKLADLNEQAMTDYYEVSNGKASYEILANTYLKSYYVVQPGNGKVAEQTITHEQIASKDFYGSPNKNDYDESIYMENYSLSRNGQSEKLMEKEFDELFAKFNAAKGAKIIYQDDYKSASLSNKYSFDLNRAKKELLTLAETVAPSKVLDVVGEELEPLKLKLAQSVVLEMPYEKAVSRNAATLVKNVENGIETGLPGYEDGYFPTAEVDNALSDMKYVERKPIEQVITDYYGMTVDEEEFNALASGENRLLAEDYYQYPVQEQVDSESYTYRQLLGIEQLENGYDAVQFADYLMPNEVIVSDSNENTLIAGEKLQEGYVLFKRLPLKSGVKWVYIDTVSHIQDMNTEQYKTYENTLPLVQKYIGEQQVLHTEQEEPLVVAASNNNAQKESTAQPEPTISWALLSLGIVLFFGAAAGSYYVYRKKYRNE